MVFNTGAALLDAVVLAVVCFLICGCHSVRADIIRLY